MDESKYLPIYLNDHLAAAVAAVRLARRSASSNRDSAYGETLANLAEEINDDRHALQELMKCLGVRGDVLKMLASVGAERVGRLKLNGELLRYSPLSRLEEIEILSLGVAGKLALWRVLRPTLGNDPRVDLDFERLIDARSPNGGASNASTAGQRRKRSETPARSGSAREPRPACAPCPRGRPAIRG